MMLSGGLAALHHYLLRYLLDREGLFPWRARPFLENVGQRNLLRCIDGKQSFPHNLLRDYFANGEGSLREDGEHPDKSLLP
jgi:hypothetical protein